ncbi:ORF-89 [Agrotis segetum nucleopolyhedrovirus A]|uniref:ORF-89 n=1 Tax=Agrotis segetum nuclear polyhedrosis virus TaxID=1962501 RepID=Q287I3_NPVAS|nr:ORF-89 [Agrotis segetum nucleopolyhedrovirus A]AAZ38255.1 ORF-89 [Agrotis segetum nucleopolyhedrovirus A]
MATSNSGTVDISVHVTLDKEADKSVLSFIVREEYHLKKLAVGAYSLNILDTQLLNDLARKSCATIACGDYVIAYNFTENSNKINVILFNIKPSVLKKGKCIFKLIYVDATTDKMLDEPVEQQEQHANSQLFKSAFAPDTDGTSSDESDEDDDGDKRKSISESDPNIGMVEDVPAKRQKLDDHVESKV